jgi:aspartate racemase
MRKRIGLIGGVSYQSTVEYYTRIMNKYNDRYNDMEYPEMVIYSLSHGRFKKYEDNRQLNEYVEYIHQAIKALECSKVDFIALAANSPHSVLDQIKKITSTPLISALDSAYNEAKRLRLKKVLLLGIKYTMQSSYFQNRFSDGSISVIVPSPKDQDDIHSIIYDELMKGIIKDSSKQKLYALFENYHVDGVVLGCMKLPMILKTGESKIKFVDTLDLHTTDIINAAVGISNLV